MDILNAFWDDFACQMAASPQVYLERTEALGDLIDQFGDRWKKPFSTFEVIYSVEYLAVGQDPITLLGVEFFAPTDEALEERSIPKPESTEGHGWAA